MPENEIPGDGAVAAIQRGSVFAMSRGLWRFAVMAFRKILFQRHRRRGIAFVARRWCIASKEAWKSRRYVA
jgi:hypothetical protein